MHDKKLQFQRIRSQKQCCLLSWYSLNGVILEKDLTVQITKHEFKIDLIINHYIFVNLQI